MSECVLTDCENGILHEYDCNDYFGDHTTGVIYCPMCHPEQYEPDSDPLIAAPEMLELIQALANTWRNDCQFIPCDTEAAYEIGSKLAGLAERAAALLAKIEGGEG